ncbi:hypothetical protein MUK42_14300 [Musa troglodytarum]|uniref:Uncharacterized protein n=1 Tax=Musa troglodytarum TaxID=320322 RepID=A0A9E7LBK1_9LILI|nr:hypothetical protein MUK42_14300 [Musa troglodytarum]
MTRYFKYYVEKGATLTGIAELQLHLISTIHDGGRTLRLRFGLLPTVLASAAFLLSPCSQNSEPQVLLQRCRLIC